MAKTQKISKPQKTAVTPIKKPGKRVSAPKVAIVSQAKEYASSLKLPFNIPTNYRPSKRAYLIILVIGLLLLASYKKSWFVAATVNGAPITNFELLSKMNDQYRKTTLNSMVNEKIISGEAQKKGVTASEQEITNKITQLEGNVGGAQALDGLLTQQGQDRAGLRKQLQVQIMIEKLYDNEATVSAAEVNQFIDQNKDQLQATSSAAQAKEATDIIKQQKLQKIFSDKFQQLKQNAKIVIF